MTFWNRKDWQNKVKLRWAACQKKKLSVAKNTLLQIAKNRGLINSKSSQASSFHFKGYWGKFKVVNHFC